MVKKVFLKCFQAFFQQFIVGILILQFIKLFGFYLLNVTFNQFLKAKIHHLRN
jgi:hypothetical protein